MNAQVEFTEFVHERPGEVIAAFIKHKGYDHSSLDDVVLHQASLPLGYTAEQLAEFLSQLNFDYDAGFGTQYLFGNIWFDDKTWAERKEYDGSEWWIWCECPTIPVELGGIQ